MSPILSGFNSAALLADALLGSMVIAIDGTVAYGATSGEPTVNLPRTFENLAFDGKLVPIAGLDRKMDGVPSIEGTFIELNPTKGLDLEPGGTTASAGGITTITPGNYGDFLLLSECKQNVRAICRRAGGGIVAIEFDYALLIVDTIVGASADKGMVKIRLEARQNPAAASLGAPLHTIKFAADLATIVAADP
jgi:hypothetical protein